jgi:hypothetical protein
VAATPPVRSSAAYSRTFSMLLAGAFLFVTGAIGWDVSYLRGFFAGGRWASGPIWWQITLGALLLSIGIRQLRRLEPDLTILRRPPPPTVKHAGSGKSAGAAKQRRRRTLHSGEPDHASRP